MSLVRYPRSGWARRWYVLRTDIRWLLSDLRGRGRPPRLSPAGPSRYRQDPAQPREFALRVQERREENAGAVSLRLAREDRGPIAHRAGQFLVVVVPTSEGRAVMRAYSISSAVGTATWITVRRRDGGFASNALCDLQPGARIRARRPAGRFVVPELESPKGLVLVAEEEGITPIVSILESYLRQRAEGTVVLLYRSESADKVIFDRRLRELARREGERFALRELHGTPITSEHLHDLFAPRLSSDAHFFVCASNAVSDAARAELRALGVEASRVHVERFFTPRPAYASAKSVQGPFRLTVKASGRSYTLRCESTETLLNAARREGVPMPFSCTMGGCGACRVHVLSGEVSMPNDSCLSAEEESESFALACSAYPRTDLELEILQ